MNVQDIPIAGSKRRLLTALNRAYPNAVAIPALADEIYGYDRDGGPNGAHMVVRQVLRLLRHHLPRYGWTITRGRPGPGSPGVKLEQLS